MSERTAKLAERIRAFSNEVIAFVENMSAADWAKICDWEQWTTGVTAYHIGAGHLAIFNFAEMIVKGEQLPELTMDQINAMSNRQAAENAHCTKAEALEQLQSNRDRMASYVMGLNDQDLDLKGGMPAFEGDVTAEQLIEFVVFQSARQHFDNIKKALQKT